MSNILSGSNNNYTFSIDGILREARFRWLKSYEVLCILQNHQTCGLQLSSVPINKPPSGSIFLFNRKEVKFRKDGVNWKKQKDKKTVRESHEKLRVGGNKLLSCCYAQCEDIPTFRRRIYWLLDGDSSTALVHYLDENMMQERGINEIVHSPLSASSPLQKPQISSPILLPPREPLVSLSPNSRFNENIMDFVDTFSSNSEIPNVHNYSESIQKQDMNLMSPEKLSWNNEIDYSSATPSPIFQQYSSHHVDNSGIIQNMYTNQSPVQLNNVYNQQIIYSTNSYQQTPSFTITSLVTITDFSPEWDYLEGGSKVLITGPDFRNVSGRCYYCMFDKKEVPAELIQDGVLRCRTPPHHQPGQVTFCVTLGNNLLFTEVKQFEYRRRDNAGPEALLLNVFKIRIVERLERIEKEMKRKNPVSSSIDSQNGISEEEFEHLVLSILIGILGQIEDSQFINKQDQDGFTLLHYFCGLGYIHLVRTIIRCGARRDITDRFGNIPCQLAVKNGHQAVAKLLMDSIPLENSIERIAEEFESLGLQNKIAVFQQASEDQEILDKAATKIQHAYRRHKALREKKSEDLAAAKIQHAYRIHRRSLMRLETTVIKIQNRVRRKLALRRKEKTKLVENEAAKKIQEAYKRYLARASTKQMTS